MTTRPWAPKAHSHRTDYPRYRPGLITRSHAMGFMSIDRLIARRRSHPTYGDSHALRRPPCSRGRRRPHRSRHRRGAPRRTSDAADQRTHRPVRRPDSPGKEPGDVGESVQSSGSATWAATWSAGALHVLWSDLGEVRNRGGRPYPQRVWHRAPDRRSAHGRRARAGTEPGVRAHVRDGVLRPPRTRRDRGTPVSPQVFERRCASGDTGVAGSST